MTRNNIQPGQTPRVALSMMVLHDASPESCIAACLLDTRLQNQKGPFPKSKGTTPVLRGSKGTSTQSPNGNESRNENGKELADNGNTFQMKRTDTVHGNARQRYGVNEQRKTSQTS